MRHHTATAENTRRPGAAAALAASLLLAGCGDGGPTGPLDNLPRPLTAAEEAVVGASNAFGLELMARVHAEKPEKNLFLSPLSAHMALGLALNGAEEETFEAMRRTLGFAGAGVSVPPPDLAEVNRAYADLIELLLGLDPSVEAGIGNSVWLRQGFALDADYAARVREAFDAEARELDFSDPAAVETINGWVAEATRDRIDEMFTSIPSNVQAILLNAIYFEGAWTEAFDPDRTRTLPFRLADGTEVDVPLMRREKEEHRAWIDPGHLAMADLPYGRDAFVMTVVVPQGETTVDDLVAELDPVTWREWTDRLEPRTVTVGLPRFTLEWEKVLNDVLKAMGMEVAFDDRAHFGGMVEGDGNPGLFISEVKQKAFVEVDEEGTVAAAATSVSLADSGAPEVVADRPFLFAIRERFSGTLLFLGKVMVPPAS